MSLKAPRGCLLSRAFGCASWRCLVFASCAYASWWFEHQCLRQSRPRHPPPHLRYLPLCPQQRLPSRQLSSPLRRPFSCWAWLGCRFQIAPTRKHCLRSSSSLTTLSRMRSLQPPPRQLLARRLRRICLQNDAYSVVVVCRRLTWSPHQYRCEHSSPCW